VTPRITASSVGDTGTHTDAERTPAPTNVVLSVLR
jgi:hypothetical protein